MRGGHILTKLFDFTVHGGLIFPNLKHFTLFGKCLSSDWYYTNFSLGKTWREMERKREGQWWFYEMSCYYDYVVRLTVMNTWKPFIKISFLEFSLITLVICFVFYRKKRVCRGKLCNSDSRKMYRNFSEGVVFLLLLWLSINPIPLVRSSDKCQMFELQNRVLLWYLTDNSSLFCLP